MKAYTDIEQSKKLAEILPIESADMSWCNNSIRGINYTDEFSAYLYTIKEVRELFDTTYNGWDKYWELIPCWSLAALLAVLPISLNTLRGVKWNAMASRDGETMYVNADNPVDACYELVLKLHELNLL